MKKSPSSFAGGLALIAALAAMLLAILLLDAQRRSRSGFVDMGALNAAGVAAVCEAGSSDPRCGSDSKTFSGDVNVGGKMFFKDPKMSASPGGTNGTDPYYLEKVVAGANNSSLRLTINDDADESLQIWGNSCGSGDCAGAGSKAHHFRADGSAAHRGAVVAGHPDTAQDMWGFNFGLQSYNPVVRAWSHFPWVDGRNYVRGPLTVDGSDATINGKLVVNRGDGSWNWLRVAGNHGDNAYFGSDANNRGIWADGPRDFTIFNQGNAGVTVKQDGTVRTSGTFCVGDACVTPAQFGRGQPASGGTGSSGQAPAAPAAGPSDLSINGYSVKNRFMAPGSLVIGDNSRNYGGGSGWSGNTAGLMLEALDSTEIAVHDYGNRIASLMHYKGGASANSITLGRDMGWGAADVRVASKLCIGDTCVTEQELKSLLALQSDVSGLAAAVEADRPTRPGLAFRIFRGYFNDDVTFAGRAQVAYGQGVAPNVSDVSVGTNGIVAVDGPLHDHSIEWTGLFKAQATGQHSFWITSDDASYVWIGPNATSGWTVANATINNGGGHGMVERTATVQMVKGTMYALRILYGEGGGGHNCVFAFQQPGGQRDAVGKGYFFNNRAWRKGRFVRLQGRTTGQGDNCMNVAEVRVTDANGKVVSAGKPVDKSSGYQGDMFPGANLVDGNTNNFMHTSCSEVPWARIDLQAVTEITQIRVHNRADCCQARLVGTVVQVLDADGRTVVFESAPLGADMVQDVYP